jgi:hypothetical protein
VCACYSAMRAHTHTCILIPIRIHRRIHARRRMHKYRTEKTHWHIPAYTCIYEFQVQARAHTHAKSLKSHHKHSCKRAHARTCMRMHPMNMRARVRCWISMHARTYSHHARAVTANNRYARAACTSQLVWYVEMRPCAARACAHAVRCARMRVYVCACLCTRVGACAAIFMHAPACLCV